MLRETTDKLLQHDGFGKPLTRHQGVRGGGGETMNSYWKNSIAIATGCGDHTVLELK